jgi:hypothetical protein
MLRPPPVSDEGYSSHVGAEERSNFLRLGLRFSTAYISNLYPGSGTTAISETTYSIWPTIAFDATTYRQHTSVSYNPGFTFYHPSSTLNEIDQSANVTYSLRLTPHVAINASDSFLNTSTAFSPTSSIPGGPISGSASSSTPNIIAPFAKRLSNVADASASFQFSPTGMIGVSGGLYNLHYPDLAEVPGIYNSDERRGGFFYSHRISGTQYIGARYSYARTLTFAPDAEFETQTHTIYFFYTIYLKEHLSISVSGGPQYYDVTQPSTSSSNSASSAVNNLNWKESQIGLSAPQQSESDQTIPASSSWSTAVATSVDWQERHTNFVASYDRSVIAGGGLLGTFALNSASATARWQLSRTWTVGASANYSIVKTVNPLFISSTTGGHTISATAIVDHPLTSRFNTSFEYDRVHQSYAGIAVITANPDTNRFVGSISWQLSRPLGR